MTEADIIPPGSSGIVPVERYDTLADRAYEQLRHALMSGSFQPGQKVTIRKMAAVLGVSATPAREAINRLVTERVLETGPFRTVSVPTLNEARLGEIYVMRTALEGVATELGARKMGARHVEKLERTQMALIGALDRKDYGQALLENEAFHFTIYEASEMPMLVEGIQQLWLKLGPSLNLLYPSHDRSRKGVNHHLDIIQALRKGDAAAARKAMEDDLRDGEVQLRTALASNDHEARRAAPTIRARRAPTA